MQPLLTMLAASMSFAANVDTAQNVIQEVVDQAIERKDQQRSVQLEQRTAALSMMAQKSVTSEEVQDQITKLLTSTLDQECAMTAQSGGNGQRSMTDVNLALQSALMPQFEERMAGMQTSIEALTKDMKVAEARLSSQIGGIMHNLLSLANVDDGTIQLGKSTIIKV